MSHGFDLSRPLMTLGTLPRGVTVLTSGPHKKRGNDQSFT